MKRVNLFPAVRQKAGAGIFWLAVFAACNVWAAPPSGEAVGLNQARGVAFYIMGYHAELLDKLNEAAACYQRSIREDGSSSLVRMRLALVYAELNRTSEALSMAEDVARRDPHDLAARYFLAVLYGQLKDSEKSSAEYEYIFKTLAAKNPSSGEFRKYLGQLYYANGKDEMALEQFKEALKLDPKDCSLLYILGAHALDGKKRAEGFELIRRCLEIEPENSGCLNSQAYAYAEDNIHLDEALKSVNAALEIEPDNPAYLDTRGWVYYRLGRYEEAMADLKRADGIQKDPVILEHLSEVALKLGQPDESRKFQQEKEHVLNAASREKR